MSEREEVMRQLQQLGQEADQIATLTRQLEVAKAGLREIVDGGPDEPYTWAIHRARNTLKEIGK